MGIKYFLLSLCCWVIGFQSLCAAPIITSIYPTHGDITGGNAITISGSGFSGAANVNFGFRPAISYNVINDTTINAVVPTGTAGVVDVTVTAMAVTSSLSADDYYTYTTEGWTGIISATEPNDVVLFNTDTDAFTTNIVTASTSLTSVINPAGTFIYTANDAPPSISVIDAATNTIVATIPTSVGPGAFDMIVNPAGTRLYLSNINSGYVTVIDTTNNTVVTDIFILPNLGPISITPDGKTVYATNFSVGIFPIDTATNTLLPLIPTGFFPGKMVITPDGTKAYIPVYFPSEVLVLDLPSQTQTNAISVSPSFGPYGASILPNSKELYIANIASNSITVIDLATETVTATIPLSPPFQEDAQAFWVAATPDSKKVYVINQTAAIVLPIDVATHSIGTAFMQMDGLFQDLVISPDPAPVAAFKALPQVIGSPTLFNAPASISPIGTIVSYAWDFGDGKTLVTSSSLVSHTYSAVGNYNVTLTVTNSAGTSTSKVFSSGFMSKNGGPSAQRGHTVSVLAVPSPIDPIGFQLHCRFLTQTNITNVIKWSSPVGYTPVFYLIFRDANLTKKIGRVDAHKPLKFEDPNRKKNKTYTYYIVSVNSLGDYSLPAIVTIKPRP